SAIGGPFGTAPGDGASGLRAVSPRFQGAGAPSGSFYFRRRPIPLYLRGMKITHVICQILRVESVQQKTASCQDVVLVRIRTDNGLEGIGEADASPEVVKAIIDAPFSHNIACGLRQLLIGENPLETERLWQKMYRRTMYFGRTAVTICAMSAVDMAL